MEPWFDSDDDSDGEPPPAPPPPRRAAPPPPNRLPLHQFLRLIAGGRAGDPDGGGAASSNEELVRGLRRGGALTCAAVEAALLACPRDVFLPPGFADDAFVDAPIRVEALGFNVSAPHMHAACLEALALRPGHRVLDVGTGCGAVAAAAAFLVGAAGRVVGIDTRPECVALARAGAAALAGARAPGGGPGPFAASGAAPPAFEVHDVFLPSPRHAGQYDRVHVGGSVPPDKLGRLVPLLDATAGGLIVVPVAPSDLRLLRLAPAAAGGGLTQRVISQVRFSELDIPPDAEIVLATLAAERRARAAAAREAAAAAAAGTGGGGGDGDCSKAAPPPAFAPSTSPVDVAGFPASPAGPAPPPPSWGRPRSADGGSPRAMDADGGSPRGREGGGAGAGADPAAAAAARLGPPDTVLVGRGWHVPAHRAALAARCDVFRARRASGMADAEHHVVTVPDHLPRAAVEALVAHAYAPAAWPRCLDAADGGALVAALHAALYYGAPRLAHRVERALARPLRAACGGGAPAADVREAAEAAAPLLALADDAALPYLRAAALDFIAEHQPAVAATDGWAALTAPQVGLVAAHAAALLARVRALLEGMAAAERGGLPDPA